MTTHPLVVVIDGKCVLCDGFGKFVTNRNNDARLMWAQHPNTVEFLKSLHISATDALTSIVVVKEGNVTRGSDAFIEVLSTMKWYWRTLAFFMRMFPKCIREFIYRHVSSNRYSLFGEKQTCSVTSATAIRSKFLHPV
jgi:predicted DCC family thiol-disulfide oxidoreductase YuxK